MDITIKTKLWTFYNAKFRIVMRYVGSGIKGVELIVESGIRESERWDLGSQPRRGLGITSHGIRTSRFLRE